MQLAWYLVAALGGIAFGAVAALGFGYLLAETLLKIYDKNENPSIDQDFDPDEERLDLIAIRDLLTATTIVGAFNGGEDTNLRHALGELRTVAAAAHDRFDELIEDLDDAAGDSVDDARPICLKCKIPFDPTDTSSEGSAMHGGGPFCRHCVTLCHDSEIADHRCMVCTPKTEAGGR